MNQKDKAKIIDNWIKDNQGKYFCHCGCNKIITIRRFHHSMSIPKYINGHQFKDKHHTQKTKQILHDKNKNQIPWNKGIPRTQEEKDKISSNLIGKLRGIHKSESHKINIGNANRGKHNHIRENNPNWKGGISTINHLVRTNVKTTIWIRMIFERDNYTCKECGQIGCTLNAHHIKPVHQILKDNNILTIRDILNCNELWLLSNGKTLCKTCHDKINKRK